MKRLELLDYGRFCAAAMVVLFHYSFNGIANGKVASISHIPGLIQFSKYGFLGVELFFLISGYVIFHSARNRTAAQFASSRAVRLYPSYWFAVLFTAFFARLWGNASMAVTPAQVLANLSMFQSYIRVPHVDGVYWTLVLEMQFYIGVLFFLLIGWQGRLESIFTLWPFLMAAAWLAGVTRAPLIGGYFSYFAAGGLFAILKERPNWKAGLALALAFCLGVNYSISVAADKVVETGTAFSPYVVAAVVTAFFLFFFALGCERVQKLHLPGSRTLGALTYPVYLIHAHFGYIVLNRFATSANKAWVYFLTVASVLLVAYGMHRVVEVRFAAFWKKLSNLTVHRAVSEVQRAFDAVLGRAAVP